MQALLITLAVILLALWLTAHLIGALFHLIGWLFHLIPYVVVALIVAAIISRFMSRRI